MISMSSFIIDEFQVLSKYHIVKYSQNTNSRITAKGE